MSCHAIFPKVFAASCLAFAISGCALAQSRPGIQRLERAVDEAPPASASVADPADASRDYEKAARAASGSQADRLLLSAAEAAFEAEEYRRAGRLMDELAQRSLEPAQRLRFQVLSAALHLHEGRAYQALHALPEHSPRGPQAMVARVEDLRAQALFALGDPAAAVQALVVRERQLSEAADVTRNQDRIWEGLQQAELNRNVLVRAGNFDSTVRGWIELALLDRQGADAAALEAWRRTYTQHPGAERLGMVAAATLPAASAPAFEYSGGRDDRLALLLPVSGGGAATADAVRDGFLSAYYRGGGRQGVRIYDAGATSDTAVSAYQQALRDGAAFVVGPVRKESVAAIAALGQPPAPVLALNYLDNSGAAPFNFFQFGLAPEDEARAAAEQAAGQGYKRAVMLVPTSDWGGRVASAFEQRLAALGGQVLETARYAQGDRDFSDAILGLFNLDQSKQRHAALVSTLGVKSEFEPRRRDDIDFVFFAARSQEARMIWPQFRFHRAADLPAFTTSSAYDGAAEPELSGVRVCDMPFMAAGGAFAASREESTDLPSLKAYPRLFALGADAYELVTRLQRGDLRAGQTLAGASGALDVGGGNAVARLLGCGVIQPDGLRLTEASASP